MDMNTLLKQLTARLLQGKTIGTSTPSTCNSVSTNVTSITNNISNATCMVGCSTGGGTATVSNVIAP